MFARAVAGSEAGGGYVIMVLLCFAVVFVWCLGSLVLLFLSPQGAVWLDRWRWLAGAPLYGFLRTARVVLAWTWVGFCVIFEPLFARFLGF